MKIQMKSLGTSYIFDVFIIKVTVKVLLKFSGIQWHPGQPDGGKWQNHVGLQPLKQIFNDLSRDTPACVSCEVQRSTTFTLRGICMNSYLETEYIPTNCGGYLGFHGNIISIW